RQRRAPPLAPARVFESSDSERTGGARTWEARGGTRSARSGADAPHPDGSGRGWGGVPSSAPRLFPDPRGRRLTMTEKIATKLNGKQSAALKAYEEVSAALAKLSGLTHALKCLALSTACEEREQAILAISAFAQGECRSASEQVQLLY